MADSLLQTVKTGGQQLQMSQQDVSSLAKAAGSPIAPTTPQGVAGIGGNPDVSKMAGTPNQVASAVKQMRVNPTGGKDLATAVREAQLQSTQTAEQAQLAQQAKELGGLGSLQSRVPEMIKQAYDKAASQSGPVSLQIDQTQLGSLGLSGDALAKATSALQTLASPTATQDQKAEAAAAFNTASGHTAENVMDASVIQHMFLQPGQDEGASLAAAVQGKMPTDVTIGMLQPTQLGFQNWGELDGLLGVKPGASQNMTVAQLGAAVQAKQSGQYNTEAQWKQILSDPTASANLRSTARTMLQGMGATGIDTAEASVQKLTQQVKAANTVSFFGQSMTVDQALSSDTVKGTIANYLNDPTYAAQVKQSDPSLANWIDSNQHELQTVVSNVGEAEQSVAKATADTQAQYANGGLSDATIKMLDPSYGQVTATFKAAPATVADMAKMPADMQAPVGQTLNSLANGATLGVPGAADLLKQFASIGGAGIQNYFATPQAAQLTNENIQQWVAINTPGQSASSVVNALAGSADLAGASGAAKTAAGLAAMGISLPTNAAMQALSSSDPKAQAAALSKLVQPLQFAPGGSFSSSIASELTSGTQAFDSAVGGLQGIKASIAKTLQTNASAGGDAKLSDSDIGNLMQEAMGDAAGGDLSSFHDMEQALQAGGYSQAQTARVTSGIYTAAQNYITKALASANAPGGSMQGFQAAIKSNTDLGTADSYLTSAQQALKAAQTQGADPMIIQDLQSLVSAAQANQKTIQQGHQAVINSMAPTAGKMDSQANKQVGANPGGNPLQRASSGGVAGAVRQAKKLF